jgi:creatinine amidohydrolase/Fe(II)-dependent formamide hydrolase-like protein
MSDRTRLAAQASPAVSWHPVSAGFCLALALAMPAARAQPPDSVFLEDLTWTELRDAIGAGKSTALIPIGGTEQNGPDIALGKHNQRVRYLAERIARSLGNAIVAPVIAYVPEGRLDPPTSHMRFPGTITIPDETFQKTLEYAARSLRAHGFRDIFFLGDHGGYRQDLQPVADRLNREWAGGPTRVHALQEYLQASGEGFARLLRQRGFPDEEIGTHAALADTSLMLAVDPRAVRSEALSAGPPPGPSQGVYGGDPRRASADLGRVGIDHIVTATVAAIRARTARGPR